MPELPEVETIKRDLSRKLKGARLQRVEVSLPKIVSPGRSIFMARLRGVRILKIRRRAKLLVFDLSTGERLHIHLKMTGQLVLRHRRQIICGGHTIIGAKTLPNKYTHVIFYFTNGDQLYFNDLRRFGYVRLLGQKNSDKELLLYGVEPLSSMFRFQYFLELLAQSGNARLKPFLLDQKKIAGLGNIYVDETCFRAKVRPTRRLKTLTIAERRSIWRAIVRVLKLSIKYRGTTFNSYLDSDGKAGKFWRYRQVYGRANEPCRACFQPLKRIRLAGRGTVHCSSCQH